MAISAHCSIVSRGTLTASCGYLLDGFPPMPAAAVPCRVSSPLGGLTRNLPGLNIGSTTSSEGSLGGIVGGYESLKDFINRAIPESGSAPPTRLVRAARS